MFQTTLVGNQPKISNDPKRVNLRNVRNRCDKGKATAADVEDALRATIAWTVSDQEAAEIDRVTDGRIRWDDPVTPFAAAHDGFSPGGLIRYFDNNVYYRRPAITERLAFRESAVAGDFRRLRESTSRPVMAAVCGPFSLARFCTNEHYKNDADLYADCAVLVNRELQALAEAGAEWVQLDEPFLGFCPDTVGEAVGAIAAAVQGVNVKTFVYTYFGSLAPVIERLWDLPVAAIGADCATVPGNFDCLLRGPETMGRGFGLIDARSTRLEPPDFLIAHLERIAEAGAESWPCCWITPSAGLEFLPYQNAQAKMQRPALTTRQVAGQAPVG